MIARKIAGRGELGNLNWGADFSRSKRTLQKELKELKKHIGEKVLLTGGGGHRASHHTLVDAWIEPCGKRWALQAKVTPSISASMGEFFTPYLDSWQISVIEK